MKSVFRSTCILVIIFIATLIITGCAKLPPAAVPVSHRLPLSATPEDKRIIVAKVNAADITNHSLIQMMNRMGAKNAETSVSEPLDETRKRALDKLIFQELSFQEAVRQGLRVEQSSIDKAISNLRENVGGEQKFQDFLAKELITEAELRSQVERILLYDLIIGKEVREKASVTADDVRKEYEQRKDQYITREKITVADVVLFLKQDDPASIKKANEIIAKINADKDKDPMNLVADGTFIVRNLDINKEKDPALYEAARKLKQGDLSGVITTSDSLHIIRLTEYAPERQLPYEEVKDPLEGKLKTAALKKRLQEWDRELKKDAKIEIMGPGVSSR